MKRAKLDKLRRELEGLRGKPQKPSTLESLARRLGRKRVKRGKEPTWESDLPGVYPVSIPHHGKKDIPKGTVNSILASLEADITALDLRISANGHGGKKEEDKNEDEENGEGDETENDESDESDD